MCCVYAAACFLCCFEYLCLRSFALWTCSSSCFLNIFCCCAGTPNVHAGTARIQCRLRSVHYCRWDIVRVEAHVHDMMQQRPGVCGTYH